VALIVAAEAPYVSTSLAPAILAASLVLFLGMIPIAVWLHSSIIARSSGTGVALSRVAELVGLCGMSVAAAVAILTLPRWMPAVQAQILTTSALGLIGIWLLTANALALSVRLLLRVLGVLGAFAGLTLLLSAVVMWIELGVGNLGGLVSIFESLRTLGGYLGEAFYIIWALWLGIWLLVRKR
jgi:hypothetical protein